MLAACLTGALAMWLWMSSVLAWQSYLEHAEQAGRALFYALRDETPSPPGLHLQKLPFDQAELANSGAFANLENAPKPALLTYVTLAGLDGPGGNGGPDLTAPALSIAILSQNLRYPISDIQTAGNSNSALALGYLSRSMAAFCSPAPLVVANYGARGWHLVEGNPVWSCAAAPDDFRLVSVGMAAVALIALLTSVAETSAHFRAFAHKLRHRHRTQEATGYELSGPSELRETQEAVNTYLARERAALAQRATVLSGVSHDLGTPATRLRLRAALIENDELREKLETDIDKMTGMIESVLTYTRSELNAEAPRRLSLLSLVEAVVADYQDMGAPVSLTPYAPAPIARATSVFASRRTGGSIDGPETHPVLVNARPITLGRALSNLIDNALKYGRQARVSLTATSEHATIMVEDEGSNLTSAQVAALIAPFQRGTNTIEGDGFGLGLTVVAAVAEHHGGSLSFEDAGNGTRAVLTIERG